MTDAQNQDLAAVLERLSTRWMAGHRGAPLALPLPDAWRPLLASETALLAMVAQCRQFLLQPVAPAGLRSAPRLPAPALPLLPDAARVLFRRALGNLSPTLLPVLLQLLAVRGYMAHPFDWRPQPDDDAVPPAYEAWRQWAAQHEANADVGDDEWDALTPAQRRQAWYRLRARDPAQARAVLQQQLPSLPAEQRLALVEGLASGLGADDLPLLQSLSGDRSEKVRQCAQFLGARLGVRAPLSADAAAELRADFECTRSGMLRRHVAVTLPALKTAAQRALRRERLSTVSWSDLAEVLDLEPLALAAALQVDSADSQGLAAVWQCAERSADAAVVARLVERLVFDPAASEPQHAGWALGLAQRLPLAERQQVALRALHEGAAPLPFSQLAALAHGPLPLSMPVLLRSRAWAALIADLRAAGADAVPAAQARLEAAALGCLLPQASAQAALEALVATGLHPGEPLLDLLRLNALLPATVSSQGSSA